MLIKQAAMRSYIVSKYDQEIPRSQTAKKTPWHREEEPHNNHETPGRQTKQTNQLSLPHQDDCKTRMDTSNAQQKKEQLQNPTMRVTINNESTTTTTTTTERRP